MKTEPIPNIMEIKVEEDVYEHDLSTDMKAVLDERLLEDSSTYLTGEESFSQLTKKYGI